MKYLLSFSIGAILGDIFFHLLPESYHSHLIELNHSQDEAHKKVGFSVIAGIFMFIIVEMVLQNWSKSHEEGKQNRSKENNQIESESSKSNFDSTYDDLKQSKVGNHCDLGVCLSDPTEDNNNLSDFNNYEKNLNNDNSCDHNVDRSESIQKRNRKSIESKTIIPTINGGEKISSITPEKCKIIEQRDQASGQIVETAGYLSLIANGFDNFTHGLAIGASFLVGPKVGLLTTFVIFIHEIPHEICDYAILVNSGFSRLDAVKAQSSVSLFGILGTATALYVKSLETLNSKTIWILPFSAGGFLYIALVNLLPDILEQDTDIHNSVRQIACVIIGISFMGAIAII